MEGMRGGGREGYRRIRKLEVVGIGVLVLDDRRGSPRFYNPDDDHRVGP